MNGATVRAGFSEPGRRRGRFRVWGMARRLQAIGALVAIGVLAIGMLATVATARAEPASAPAGPAEPITVRAGDHSDFGRLVFDITGGTKYRFSRKGDRVSLTFPRAMVIGEPAEPPRNVLSASGGSGEAELVVAAGARVRHWRIDGRLVIDVFDPKPAQTLSAPPADPLPVPPIPSQPTPPAIMDPSAAATPESQVAPASVSRPADATGVQLPASALPGPEMRSPPPLQSSPLRPSPRQPPPSQPPAVIAAPSGPVTLVVARTAPPVAGQGAAFSVPFGAEIGAAALRRGDIALVVFDDRRPVDLAALRGDPILAGATVRLLPAATLIQLRLPEGMEVALLRPSPNAWTVAVRPGPVPIHPIQPVMAPEEIASAGHGRLLLSGDAAGQVVSLADPLTGATLMLGTQRKPGQGMAVARLTPRYALLPTWQGVAVLPLADRLSLRALRDGFALTGADLPLTQAAAAEDAESQAAATALTRRFDFPLQSIEDLQRRLQSQVADAARAPAQARGRKRLAAAQTMIAVGLGVEAGSLLQVAAEEDPVLARSAKIAGLGAIAALLADRMEETDAIEDPRLTGTDEVALWRAVRTAKQQPGSPQAAAIFAVTMPLALSYPPGLRDRLLPLMAETMVAGGENAAARSVLARRKDDPALGLARAMALQADGDTDRALAAYGAVTRGPDRREQALAASRAVELKLAAHRIDPAQAADALDSQLYNWRGGRQELELRERVATLRAESGAWRPALALLRETLSIFPADKVRIRAAMRAIFADLLHDKAVDAVAPLDLVALLDENADLLPDARNAEASQDGSSDDWLQEKLIKTLLALDLPGRAGPQLERLMQAVPPGAGRAGFGASLAGLKLREDDPRGALAALSASDVPAADLPRQLAEQRALLFAQASARNGAPADALAALAPYGGARAGDARATILEQTQDWPGAVRALSDQVASLVPTQGQLTDSQSRLLVRLASAASQAGDEVTLARLRLDLPRFPGGPLADMFTLLTGGRVQSVADLKRSGREMALARDLPQGLKSLESPPVPAKLAGTTLDSAPAR